MTEYNREELKLLNQVLLALFIVADFGLLLHFNNSAFPWFALLGSGVGQGIIVLCWSETKYIYLGTLGALSYRAAEGIQTYLKQSGLLVK